MSGGPVSLVGQYKLIRVNGKAPETPAPVVLRLEAAPDNANKLRLHVKVANSMNGVVSIEDGKLKGPLMSTRMMGTPAQMTVEHILGSDLMEGVAYTLEDKVLKMTGKTGSLEWAAE
ncbi:hypothetical protein ABB37_07961 [Leptomonas pyrrhocoris]|uniref:DUF306 domain-containing protein n=1 Tax=Leptomonas pyrrhocoris TaxID=157538 RepID=A0A0N0DSN8_LEPPY|nr:hypothetical protein ABB37_07961 [Leptomonas pyrrhocoris]XP_015654650.1 hypothetical protein ABB37_07961 [Leptomonas pyrrhocoris]XP_015654651.1 hypothetical protein ABB37_07961 [Leptomonas pyrrhocoris]KPA76210.1 hypothetical protein ABB37_07961 [Leptomonas pyrrhocoris]KPA76211.1 hypothetical protein ABB37_07961 [Leptomonas pyrrhocoris]KPA76212.1 hypothetical protein ABB37_07961 [Leptomonas pyrrhocoris]|eukprot:XP_015654649.1 hypothetical protein ABB37_07961 [Leptomonas pyrrhocoris]